MVLKHANEFKLWGGGVYTSIHGTIHRPITLVFQINEMTTDLPGSEGIRAWTRKMEVKLVNYLQVSVFCFWLWSQTSPKRGKSKKESNTQTHWQELSGPSRSTCPWLSCLLGLFHTALVCSKVLAWLWILSLYGLRSFRGHTQAFKDLRETPCWNVYIISSSQPHLQVAHIASYSADNSGSSLLGFGTHHFLLTLPVISSLLSHLAFTQVQPAFECVFNGMPKHFEKSCSVFTLKHLGYRRNWINDADFFFFFHYNHSSVSLSSNTNSRFGTWISFTNAMKSTVLPLLPNDIWSEMECQL